MRPVRRAHRHLSHSTHHGIAVGNCPQAERQDKSTNKFRDGGLFHGNRLLVAPQRRAHTPITAFAQVHNGIFVTCSRPWVDRTTTVSRPDHDREQPPQHRFRSTSRQFQDHKQGAVGTPQLPHKNRKDCKPPHTRALAVLLTLLIELVIPRLLPAPQPTLR